MFILKTRSGTIACSIRTEEPFIYSSLAVAEIAKGILRGRDRLPYNVEPFVMGSI